MAHPSVHDLVITTAAPSVLLTGADGVPRGSGAQGLLHGDRRALAGAVLTVDGEEPGPLGLADGRRVRRRRELRPGALTERVDLSRPGDVRVRLWTDFADIASVRSGEQSPLVAPTRWRDGGVRVSAPGASVSEDGDLLTLTWNHVDSLEWTVTVDDPGAVFTSAGPVVAPVEIECDDPRVAAVVGRAVEDLNSLLLSDGENTFAAAGAPWYLTLFGRDSLLAARLGLPWTHDLAVGTLRALARLQGTRHDPATGEAPGKILHERRRAALRLGDMLLPPVYYGTVDATALWVCLLGDVWKHAPRPDLLPHLRAALDWLMGSDGRYHDETGHGLANQGWKDSPDAIRFADGSYAEAPIALAEVQAYNHEALLAGAGILEAWASGPPPPGYRGDAEGGQVDVAVVDRVRERAAGIAGGFRERFWVGGIPALALDARGVAVDSAASNMGHLLGTGLLSGEESALVAARLGEPDLSCGFGLRTMSSAAGAYDPLSYHCGSVWPHDTAVAVRGLVLAGFAEQAAGLAADLLRAGAAIGELPELFAGYGREDVAVPIPYPASCRPQAWSSAGALAALAALLGLSVDGKTVTLRPPRPSPVGALSVRGIPLPDGSLSVSVDRDGTLTHVEATPGYTVITG